MTKYDLVGFNNQNLDQYMIVEKFENKEKISVGQVCSRNEDCGSGLCTNYYGSGWNVIQNGKIIKESPDTKRCAELCNADQIISNCYEDDVSSCINMYPNKINTQFKCVGKEACNNSGIPTCWDNTCINCKCNDTQLNGPIGQYVCKSNTVFTPSPAPSDITPVSMLSTSQNCINNGKPVGRSRLSDNIDIDSLNNPIDINLNVLYNNWGKTPVGVSNSNGNRDNWGKAPNDMKNRKMIIGNGNVNGKNVKVNNMPLNSSIFDRMTQMADFMK